jgi:hypothetical protein
MAVMGQLGKIQFATAAATVGGYLLLRRLWDRLFRFTGTGRLEIEQMPLALALEDPFTFPAIDPSFQTIELFNRGLMGLLQFLVRGRRLIEHSLQFRGSLKSRQQEALAFVEIVGKLRGVIHNAPCCNDSHNFEKTIA